MVVEYEMYLGENATTNNLAAVQFRFKFGSIYWRVKGPFRSGKVTGA
jgi:hypothetical protein